MASVASFFVSRVDTKVDPQLEAIGTPTALALRGEAAIANAKLACKAFDEIFGGDEFADLLVAGAACSAAYGPARARRTPPTAT